MKYLLIAFFGFVQLSTVYAQLSVSVDIQNKSKVINDGAATAVVKGGTVPYKFHWSNQSTPLTSETSTGLTEGSTHTLVVTDASGTKAETRFEIPATSADEKINSFFVPIVDAIGTFIMYDIFAALQLYDPIITDSNGTVLTHANGDPKMMRIPFVVIWLIFGAVYFTIKMRFINFREFGHAIQLIRGKYDDPAHAGEVSHFQALTAALSGTVGLGNIAGVAIAISIGGPGATFWIILAGLLGMASKFTEVTLGVKYRKIDENGVVSGGPMYYLSEGLKRKNLGKLGKVLAVLFAFLVIGGSFGGGNMFQANQAFAQFAVQFRDIIPGIEGYGAVFGIILAALTGIVIVGGIKSIARVTDKLVPIMAILYVGTALIIIGMHIEFAGEAVRLIFDGAFNAAAVKGGFIGIMIVGFQRAAFSNEAGVGSASIAHSAVKTEKPVSEGIVALLEPFIDTVIICTITALVLIFTGFYDPAVAAGKSGAELTSVAFESIFPWFTWLLTVAIFLFAFSTMISWSYYGLNGFRYLFERFFKYKKITKNMYLSTFVYYVFFLSFIVVGSSSSLGAVVDFSDFMILSMAFPNILGLLILAPEVKQDLKAYKNEIKALKKQTKQKEI